MSLRKTFPETPFVGMEPAVKPAAESTQTGIVGVLATPATFQSELYASVVERFAHEVQVMQDTCPGLVCQIEAGNLDGSETRRILEKAVIPMLDAKIDAIVLGCTHYPFVIPLIAEIVREYSAKHRLPDGHRLRVIDPAPAVARQVRRQLGEHGWLEPFHDTDPGNASAKINPVLYMTTGNVQALQDLLPRLAAETGRVTGLTWQDETRLLEISIPPLQS